MNELTNGVLTIDTECLGAIVHNGLEVVRHVLRYSGFSSFSKISFLSWFDVFPVYFDIFVTVRSEKDRT